MREQHPDTAAGSASPCLSSSGEVQSTQNLVPLLASSSLSPALSETECQSRSADSDQVNGAACGTRRPTRKTVCEEEQERTDHCEAPQRSGHVSVEQLPTGAPSSARKSQSLRETALSTRTRESDPPVSPLPPTIVAALDSQHTSTAAETSFSEDVPASGLRELRTSFSSPPVKLAKGPVTLETTDTSRGRLCPEHDFARRSVAAKGRVVSVPAGSVEGESTGGLNQSDVGAVLESAAEASHTLVVTSCHDGQQRRETWCSPRDETARREEIEDCRGLETGEDQGSHVLFAGKDILRLGDGGDIDKQVQQLVAEEFSAAGTILKEAGEPTKPAEGASGFAGLTEVGTTQEASSYRTEQLGRLFREDDKAGRQGGVQGEMANVGGAHTEHEECFIPDTIMETGALELDRPFGDHLLGAAEPHLQARGGGSARLVAAEGSSCEKGRAVWSIRKSAGADDVDVWLEGFRKNPPEILSEADLWRVCQRIKQLLVEENNVQPVPAPCIVCGDIHGQFFDLLKLFEVGGLVGEQHYVFLGDYVDRGYNSVETFQYLMLLKLKYPRHITLLRGNHESRQITTVYGFYDECVRKYGNANPWKFCTEVFDYLALAAVIDEEVFCVHGGLSPDLKLLDQLRLIYRVQEIPHEGTFGDIVWSDPDDVDEWAENPRGAGWLFGDKVVRRFNHLNGLQLIARAHQLAMEGFRYMFSDSSVVTVWSAPNYCYRCGNVAAVMKLDSGLGRRMLIFKQTDDHHVTTRARAATPYFL